MTESKEQMEEPYYYLKENVDEYEQRIYRYLNKFEFKYVPKFYSYDKLKRRLRMQKINQMSIADMYGESFEKIPSSIIDRIRDIIKELYQYGFVYPDITGYNFIEDKNGKIWIVDFEHMFFIGTFGKKTNELTETQKEHISFVEKFIEGHCGWNSRFK